MQKDTGHSFVTPILMEQKKKGNLLSMKNAAIVFTDEEGGGRGFGFKVFVTWMSIWCFKLLSSGMDIIMVASGSHCIINHQSIIS